MTLIADPHKIRRTELSRPVPPGPSSRWMIDGRAGDTRLTNGNSSITTSVGSAVTFNWVFTARHATLNWQYYIGNTLLASIPRPAGAGLTGLVSSPRNAVAAVTTQLLGDDRLTV